MDLTYVFVSLQPVGRDVLHSALFRTLSNILPFMYVFIVILIRVSHTHTVLYLLSHKVTWLVSKLYTINL